MEGSRGPFHAHATHKELRQVAPVCDRRCPLILKIPTCRSGPTKHARNETGQTLTAPDSLPLQPLPEWLSSVFRERHLRRLRLRI